MGMSEPSLHRVATSDGWKIALHAYAARGTRHVPVVLCHGLACDRMVFDVSRETSLAWHLTARGYAVFALELRGNGASERATVGGPRRFDWCFDDYLEKDIPAALETVASITGMREAHWIGHSMGGLLLYAHLATGGSPAIRSGITVGSSLAYGAANSGFHRLARYKRWLELAPSLPVPVRAAARLSTRLAGALGGRVNDPFERFNVWTSNTDRALWRRIARDGFHPVPAPLMLQLASAMEPGGLRSKDGGVAYFDGLASATAPVLALAGDRDAQCPLAAAEGTLSALGSSRREFRAFGPEFGHADHYGHFDLLMGLRAKTEVFPAIDAWLDEHD